MNLPFDPYATHLPILLAAVALTDGPVLEIGCGAYSTLCLHAVCEATGRKVVSLEEHWDYLGALDHLATDNHAFSPNTDVASQWENWDVALVDCAPEAARIQAIRDLVDCKLVVCHDSNNPDCRYEEARPLFKHWLESKMLFPHTLILSNDDEAVARMKERYAAFFC